MKTVVFGAGYWGQNYVRELAGNLVAVVEPDKDRADRMRQTYNVLVCPELPDDLEYDAACIVTPPSTHVGIAMPIVKAGRQVLIEKPIAMSVEEAMQLYPYKSRCMAAHIYLFHPVVERMKQWIRSFPVNHAFSQRTNHGPIRPWQNALWDLASHDISIFNYLFGRPIGAEVTGEQDWAVLRVNYVAVSVAVYVSWLGGPKVRRMELVSSECESRYVFDDLRWILEVSPLRRMLDAFLSGDWDRCTLDEGIEVLQVLESCKL